MLKKQIYSSFHQKDDVLKENIINNKEFFLFSKILRIFSVFILLLGCFFFFASIGREEWYIGVIILFSTIPISLLMFALGAIVHELTAIKKMIHKHFSNEY